MEESRARLADMIKTMPEDKLQILLDFASRLCAEYEDGEDADDELLMTRDH